MGDQTSTESFDRRIARLASARHGVFTRAEALREGGTRNRVAGRLADGRWELIYRGVYRLAGVPPSWRQRLAAACLAAGPSAVASHRAAGALWGLPGVPIDVIEVSLPFTRRIRQRGVLAHRVGDLSLADVVTVDGIPATTPPRTLIDLGAVVPVDALEEALDDALRRHLTSIRWLRWRIEALRRPGRPGIAAIEALCDARGTDTSSRESVLETRLLRILRRAGLPAPTSQFEIRHAGRLVARVDFAYPKARLAVEADGYRWHSGRPQWQRDLARRNRLLALGWRVVHVTAKDMADPASIVALVAQALSS